MANLRINSLTVLKIVFSVLLVYLVFTKVNFEEISKTLRKAHYGYLLLALLFFVISKVIAAFRLNLYFHLLKIPLSHLSNLKLYLLGMFYNLFLPGGIGGDAYKGYLLKKKFQVDTKKVVSVLLLDRLSGLLLLFVYACLLILFIEHNFVSKYNYLAIPVMLFALISFWVLCKLFFKFTLDVFWPSTLYSAMVQAAQLACVYFILLALNFTDFITAYLLVFLISSIVAVLPLTIGGIGSREVTFYYFSIWLALDQGISITISMVFFLITAFTSFTGIWYHFKQPRLKTNQ